MAGSYPDVPGRRMAVDADGTIGLHAPADGSDVLVEHSDNQMTTMNSESESGVQISTGADGIQRYGWRIFPELREVDGVFVAHMGFGTGLPGAFHTSGDTTNGRDGTWTQRVADLDNFGVVMGNYRDEITSTAVSNVRSTRVTMSSATASGHQQGFKAYMLYGEIAPGETPDRLLWVDNDTGSEFSLPIDYGDIPRGSAGDREVKLRNNSGSLTAASVQVTGEALYLNSGSWYTIKEAGGSFQSTLPLSSSIGAGSDSPVLTVRRVTPDDETLGLHAGRVYASVGSWS